MKMKGFWKTVIAKVLTAVMLVSVFSTVDMGWNVSKVQASNLEATIDNRLQGRVYDKTESQNLWIGYMWFQTPSSSLYGKVTSGEAVFTYRSEYGIYFYKRSNTEDKSNVVFQIPNVPEGYSVTKFVFSAVEGISSTPKDYTYNNITDNSVSIFLDGQKDNTTYLIRLGGTEDKIRYIKSIKATIHKCDSGTKVAGTDAKCNAYGVKEAYKCSCGKYYSDSTCKTLIANNENEYNTWKSKGGRIQYASHNDVYYSVNQSTKTITYKCDKGCNRTTTYTLNQNDCHDEIAYVNRNKYAVPTVTKSGDATQNAPAVRYKGLTGTTYTDTTTRPTNTGSYQAYITMGSGTVSCNFSIAPGGDIYKFEKGDTSATGTMEDQLVLKDGFQPGTKLNKNLFQKIGYAFVKWISSIMDKEFEDEAEVSEPNLDDPKTHTLTAQWKPNDYTITFNNSGADINPGTESATATYDADLPGITIPKKQCGEFKGYFTLENGSGTKIYDANGDAAITKWETASDTTLYAHWVMNHNWGYEAVDHQVIATCKNEGCGYSQSLTLTAPDSVYNKSPYNKADIESESEFPVSKIKSGIQYEGTSTAGATYDKSSTAPTNAGTYKATITVSAGGVDYTAEKEFTIDKAVQTSATATVADYEWGADTLPTPSISGVEESATPTYYYSTMNSNAGGAEWNDLTSILLDTGTYYVFAELTETANYKAGRTQPTPFIITGRSFDSRRITATSYEGTYDKAPHTIGFSIGEDSSDPDEDLIITFSDSADGPFTAAMPTFTNAGDYTVYYRVKKFGYELADGSKTVKIAKKGITITPTDGQSKTYGTPDPRIAYTYAPDLCTGDKIIGVLTYENAATNANVGEYNIVKGSLSAGGNYELTLSSEKFTINKATYENGPAVGVGYTIDYVAETLAPQSTTDFEIGKKDGEEINAVATSPVALADELSSTPLREIYYVRYKENTNQTTSPWSAITIPARPAAPNAKDKQETIENKKDAEVTGVNSTMEYKFEGDADWTTVDGAKIANPENKKITIRVKASNTNKNFYGLEKPITFTASTTKLKVRIGDTVIEVPYGGTIPVGNKPLDPTPPTGQVFMHWAFGGEKWDFDGEEDVTDPSKVTDNITLVPVWGVEIHGTITAQDYESITKVSLVDGKGNSYKHHDLKNQNDGTYKYSVIAPAGVDYNLVIEGVKKISGNSHNITKTQLVNLKQGGNGDVTMPAGVFNSKVTKEDAGNYEHTLVGGLDNIADAHNGASDVVTVEMKVSANVSNDNKIKSAIKNKTLDFVELTLTKTTNSIEENIGSTNNQLLEIIIPYKISGKYSITVYRYHDEKVDTLTSARNKDGEYFKIGSDTITIYAKKFSTYAIGYSTKPLSSGPNDSDESQGDDSGTPSGSSLPKKDITAEKKQTDVLPRLIAKNTKQKDGDEKETNTGLLASGVSDNVKDNQEKSEDVKGDSVVDNDKTQLEEGAPLSEGEAHKGKHNLLWLYLLLIIIYTVTRVITKEKTKPVKLSLAVGNAVVAGLLLLVVKVCLLSIIVCLAEIVLALIIHFVMRKKATNE